MLSIGNNQSLDSYYFKTFSTYSGNMLGIDYKNFE